MKDFVFVFYLRNFRLFHLYVAENSIITTKQIFIPRIHSENYVLFNKFCSQLK